MLQRTLIRACVPLLLAAAARLSGSQTQSSQFSSQAVTFGQGGYLIRFSVQWNADDAPQRTTSAPGRVDVVDASGSLVATATLTVASGAALPQLSGPGTISNLQGSTEILGAGGTPAQGSASADWFVTGLPPGAYTLRFWSYQEAQPLVSASTIDTVTSEDAGSGPLAPPSVTLAIPASATALAAAPLGVTATAQGAASLASVTLSVSLDGGATWQAVLTNSSPAGASDTETCEYTFATAGSALVKATAVDTFGQQASSQSTLSVSLAPQGPVVISPASKSVHAGDSVSFSVSGGATGSYQWSGAASGSGSAQTVAFPSEGTYGVSVVDSGSAAYAPSAPATATVTVVPAFFQLSASAGLGGSVSGGGSYAPGTTATVAATAAPGYTFSGWSGDAVGASPSVSIIMNSNKSVMASFLAQLPQTISLARPTAVTTATAPFGLQASATSGLPVALSLVSGPAVLSGTTLSLLGTAGTVVISASQSGNAQYLPAPTVTVSFDVAQAPPLATLGDNGAATRRSDRDHPVTSFLSGAGH